MNFGSAILTHNNLGGAGPDSGDPTMIFTNIGKYGGQQLDLIMSTGSPYTADQASSEGPNGKKEDWGARVRMKAGEALDLTLTFVQANTTTPVVISEALLSIFDLDGRPTVAGDEMIFRTFSGYVTDAEHFYNIRRQPDGATVFAAQLNSGPGAHVQNPVNPMSLTDKQRKASVMLVLRNTATVSFQWRLVPVDNAQTSYQWLFFSGASSLIDRCAD